MVQAVEQKTAPFVERRQNPSAPRTNGPERRQFSNAYSADRPEVAELARAVDQYKLVHRRRFITYEELYSVIAGLGYHK